MQHFSHKGFTLIELLVVIAIIGVLSAVVLGAMNSSRTKGKDAKVQASIAQIRALSETLYDGLKYPDGTAGQNNGFDTPVHTGGTAPNCTGDTTRHANLKTLDGEIRAQNGLACTGVAGVTIYKDSGDTAYGAAAPLPGGGYLCIDSTGISRGTTVAGVKYTILASALTNSSDVTCN